MPHDLDGCQGQNSCDLWTLPSFTNCMQLTSTHIPGDIQQEDKQLTADLWLQDGRDAIYHLHVWSRTNTGRPIQVGT